MEKKLFVQMIWISFVLAVVISGCAPAMSTSVPAAPTSGPTAIVSTPSPTAAAVMPANTAPATSPGMTVSEDQEINPPAPRAVRARVVEGVLLTWEAPPKVTGKHLYSDVVVRYNIYRRTEDEELRLIGSTTETRYLDETAKPGVTYYYVVTAVQEGEIESKRPDEVKIVR